MAFNHRLDEKGRRTVIPGSGLSNSRAKRLTYELISYCKEISLLDFVVWLLCVDFFMREYYYYYLLYIIPLVIAS